MMPGLPFERTFVAISYGLVVTSFLAVVLSGEVGFVAPVLFTLALFGSLLWRADGPQRPITARLWTALLVAALGSLIVWSLDDGNWLLHALEFVLLMTVSRLFQRRFAKDWLQLYVLTFLQMLVAAVIYPSLTFGLCFLLYTVLIIWGLTMLHLVRELEVQTQTGPEHLLPPSSIWRGLRFWRAAVPRERDPLEALGESPLKPGSLHWRSRHMIGSRFLLASSALSLVVLLISMLFFFLFPRLGIGFFSLRTRGAQTVVGFSDQVRLDSFGKLKSSTQVVMRVRFPDDPDRLRQPLRIRGVSFDRWDGRGWERLDDPDWELLHRGQRYPLPSTRPASPPERIYGATIYLEPLDDDVRVLFAPPRTLWLEFLDSQFDDLRGQRKGVRQAVSGDLSFKGPTGTALSYAVQCVDVRGQAERLAVLARAQGVVPRWVRDRWTALPSDLDPRLGQLARRLSADRVSTADQALAISHGLRSGWRYSLDGEHDPDAPLMDFLFGRREGHCEYFATAMVLMMRSLGRPARVVNGFYGGELNDFGDYRMIRQGDAHSWVEVFLPGLGWETFDPTPSSGRTATEQQGLSASLRRLADGVAMLWYTWIVEYDLESQVELFRRMQRALRKLRGGGDRGNRIVSTAPSDVEPSPQRSSLSWMPIALGLLGAVGIVVGFYLWRRRRTPPSPVFDRRLERATRRLRRHLQSLGLNRDFWQTWSLVAVELGALDEASGRAMGRFAEAYDRARFSPEQAEADRIEALARAEVVEGLMIELRRRERRSRR